jgi:hypothetical protein
MPLVLDLIFIGRTEFDDGQNDDLDFDRVWHELSLQTSSSAEGKPREPSLKTR